MGGGVSSLLSANYKASIKYPSGVARLEHLYIRKGFFVRLRIVILYQANSLNLLKKDYKQGVGKTNTLHSYEKIYSNFSSIANDLRSNCSGKTG